MSGGDQIPTFKTQNPLFAGLDGEELRLKLNEALAGKPDKYYRSNEWNDLNDAVGHEKLICVHGKLFKCECGRDSDDDSFNFTIEKMSMVGM